MDPRLKSTLTSLGMIAATAVATWMASQGLAGGDEISQKEMTDALMTIGGAIGAGLLLWYKREQHTPEAEIKAVNIADNGVKVVAAEEPVPTVTEPLKNSSK